MKAYAMIDTFVGLNPREVSHGFANTKSIVHFASRQERDKWFYEFGDYNITAKKVRAKNRNSYKHSDRVFFNKNSGEWEYDYYIQD